MVENWLWWVFKPLYRRPIMSWIFPHFFKVSLAVNKNLLKDERVFYIIECVSLGH